MFTNPGFTLGDQMYWIVDLFLKTLAPEACHRRVGGLAAGEAVGAAVLGAVCKVEGGDAGAGAGAGAERHLTPALSA